VITQVNVAEQNSLQLQPDFRNRKGWLQEEIEAAGHNVIFYPKFHCR
jgi:hypothetical protein